MTQNLLIRKENQMLKIILSLTIILCISFPLLAQQHIIVYAVDVSRSMRNLGKIEAVKDAVIADVPTVANGTHVIVIAFGTTADEVFNSPINTNADRQKLIEVIRGIKAVHWNTHFDELIKRTKLSCYETRARYGNDCAVTVKILSDGISSPDEITGKRFFNLADVVSESMPRSAGFHVYILSLEDILTEPIFNIAEVEKTGITTIPISPKDLQTVMPKIRHYENKSHSIGKVKETRNPTSEWALAYYGIPVLAIALVFVFGIKKFRRYTHQQRQFKERINKLSNPQRSNSVAFQERLKIQEILLGANEKENRIEQEQFHKVIKGLRILVGGDPMKCAFILRYSQSPEVLFSIMVKELALSIVNQSKELIVVNRQQLKPGQAAKHSIQEEISVVFRNKLRIVISRVRIPLQKRIESDQIKKIASHASIKNIHSQTTQILNSA
jgi:hypothetical protein